MGPVKTSNVAVSGKIDFRAAGFCWLCSGNPGMLVSHDSRDDSFVPDDIVHDDEFDF